MLEEWEIYVKINITGLLFIFFSFFLSLQLISLKSYTNIGTKIIYEQRNCPLINNLFGEIFRCVYCGLVGWQQWWRCWLFFFSYHPYIQCNHLIHDNLFLIIVNPHVLHPIVVRNLTCTLITHFYSFAIASHWSVQYSCGCVLLRVCVFVSFLSRSPISPNLFILFLSKHCWDQASFESLTSSSFFFLSHPFAFGVFSLLNEIDKFKLNGWFCIDRDVRFALL